MSFISVPIGKGIVKFPNIKRSQPDRERQKFSEQIKNEPSDLAFLRRLGIDGRLFEREDNLISNPDAISFTIPSGSTLFINAVVVQNISGAFGFVEFQFNSIVLETIGANALERALNSIPLFVLVGDGIKVARVIVCSDQFGAAGADCSFSGWLENTEKISAESNTS